MKEGNKPRVQSSGVGFRCAIKHKLLLYRTQSPLPSSSSSSPFRRTHLAAPPSLPVLPPRGEEARRRSPVRPTSVRIHRTFFLPLSSTSSSCSSVYLGNNNHRAKRPHQTGYELRFAKRSKHGSDADFLPAALILQLCRILVRSSPSARPIFRGGFVFVRASPLC